MARDLGTLCGELPSTFQLFLYLVFFGLPLFSVVLASLGILNTQSIMLWSFNFISIVVNTCALLFNSYISFWPGHKFDDPRTAGLCIPGTICTTLIFVFSLPCLFVCSHQTPGLCAVLVVIAWLVILTLTLHVWWF